MSAGRSRSAQCLLCPETFIVKDISDHLYEHLKYKPFRCNDCGFKCTQQSDLDDHTFPNDHTGSQCIDQYKQWLIELIKKDMQFTAKHGKDELLKSKNIALLVASAPSTPFNPPPSSNATPQQQTARRPAKSHPPAPARSPPPAIVESSSSSSDEEEARPPPRKAVSTVQKRRSDNKRIHSDEGESEDEDNFATNIKKLERELDKHFECRLCRKLIRISLADRQKHIRAEHMAGIPPDRPDYKIKMEATTKKAFPGLEWDCTQCRGCPTKKNIQSNNGRLEHVVNLHHYYLNSLYCPVPGCAFSSINPGSFKKHFSVVHSYIRWQMDQPVFYQECIEQRRKIYQISKLLFTVDLPFENRRRGSDEDEEEDREHLRALKAAPPTRPPPSRPTASKKRRSKSPLSSSSETDSEDEFPPIRKTIKEKEKVLMRNSKGNLELVEVSDDEEENEEEEEEDDKMNVGKVQTAGSTTATTNFVVRSEDRIKREPSPEVKKEEEIRQEPMTPADVASIPLPPPLSMQTLATLRAAGLPPPPLPQSIGQNSYLSYTSSPQQWTQSGGGKANRGGSHGGSMNNSGYRRDYY